jgi:hypothetical protein
VIEDGTILRRNPLVEARGLGDEGGAVLLHVSTGAYHGTNDVGALIWEKLSEPMTFGSLLETLRGDLDDVPPTLPDEISTFIERLAERDLVVVDGEGVGS